MAGNSNKGRLYGGVKTFSCPNCGGKINIRAQGQTLAYACIHCGTTIDISDENFRIIEEAKKRIRKILIPIGTRGTWKGISWEVIGYMERKAVGYDYKWEEYLLFNPIHGFAWLMNAYGHWNFLQGIIDKPKYSSGAKRAFLDGETYKHFTSGQAEVRYVLGEFYWYVHRGDKTQVRDLIQPPKILSAEWDEHGIFWSQGEYVDPARIKEAFHIQQEMPYKSGVAPNQPNIARKNFFAILPFWLVALAVMVIMQVLFYGNAKDEQIFLKTFNPGKADTTLVTDTFAIGKGDRNLEIRMHASLDNDWIEIEASLYNIDDGTDRGFKLGTEYYHGVTDGERWSEGNTRDNKILNNIPGGRYQLVLNIYSDPDMYLTDQQKFSQSVQIEVRRDVPFMANFFFLLILLSILPVTLMILGSNFEKKRWADAD